MYFTSCLLVDLRIKQFELFIENEYVVNGVAILESYCNIYNYAGQFSSDWEVARIKERCLEMKRLCEKHLMVETDVICLIRACFLKSVFHIHESFVEFLVNFKKITPWKAKVVTDILLYDNSELNLYDIIQKVSPKRRKRKRKN